MKKSKLYPNAKFSVDVLRSILLIFQQHLEANKIKEDNYCALVVKIGDETWNHDNEEEFFADYRKSDDWARITKYSRGLDICIEYHFDGTNVAISSTSREEIEKFFSIFESHYKNSIIEAEIKPKPTTSPIIFIGHGRSTQWRDLKDHLHDKHGFNIEAYETGARAGHEIRDILDEMASKSSLALLVLTAEDEQKDGTFHARQNVIHEIGLFQGRLGFSRAIVLLEDGTEEFSNLQGIEQIRYSKSNIKETFGEVLATIKREFMLPPNS